MRTYTQLIFIFIIAFIMISCGGDSNSTTNNTATNSDKNNSNKPAATFTMDSGKGYSITERPLDKPDPNKRAKQIKNPQNEGGVFSDAQGNSPINPDIPLITDADILNSIPDVCSLLSTNDIAKLFGISAEDINQKDASHVKSPYTKSCFYRWEGASPKYWYITTNTG